ncbi:hypothetical protein [Candidatus Nitrotoga sp. M5]|uniref:hypothetical protein n=1 Tax=Candidatus Nitrotoga sp. M5 TaxID=2890409 RepID=UPI001EF1CC2C|nr:hypothetical protein [Candidatus Nitrotoga sp. M5]CAH1386247.1 conserved hypothetical protein [Candidatus Nitrotoga sp. M5]
MSRFTRVFHLFGWGSVIGLLLLALVEIWLHSDDFLYRYRSVFATGRAMDKLQYVSSHTPALLVLGNSRIDNGFIPQVLLEGSVADVSGFNMGMPGANAGILYGVVKRLANEGNLGAKGIRAVLIGLDEHLLQAEDSLGYGVFYSDPAWLWQTRDWRGMLANSIRLWGFSANLKQLREPAKALGFYQASFAAMEPVGGGAAMHLGYRAGFGGLQDAGQVRRQQESFDEPPDVNQIKALFATVALLQRYGVEVAVVYPPLLNRELLYLTPQLPAARLYLAVAERLTAEGVPQLTLETAAQRNPEMFVNSGHLNDLGAHYHSRLLARQLRAIWPTLYAQEGGA